MANVGVYSCSVSTFCCSVALYELYSFSYAKMISLGNTCYFCIPWLLCSPGDSYFIDPDAILSASERHHYKTYVKRERTAHDSSREEDGLRPSMGTCDLYTSEHLTTI